MTGINVTLQAVRNAITELGLAGRALCVHSSLRSFGWVEGGAGAVIDGLLAEGCTVLVPSFTSEFETAPPADRRYPRNGCVYVTDVASSRRCDAVYSIDSGAIDRDLGAIPASVVADPRRERGNHPLNSFAAIGPLAGELVGGQAPLDVYAPLRAVAERDGWVLLMGIDLTSMTLIHLAEAMAGRTLFRRWANGPENTVIECEIGSCSEGFERLQPALVPAMRCVEVGSSLWRAYPARLVLEIASEAIRRDSTITHCPDLNCLRCRDIIQGGPIIEVAP
ncbi:MAG: AAC(3) family N-acetyltransferase [Nitrolancea sp.]